MTQEDRKLLLTDLCARLPYHPIVYVDENLPRLKLGVATRVWEYVAVDKPCKPYLRPMSSMTEEEAVEIDSMGFAYWTTMINNDLRSRGPMSLLDAIITHHKMVKLIDWLNAHHFDYRGLIPMGLALEAPEGMY
jgi:hypothetical protein